LISQILPIFSDIANIPHKTVCFVVFSQNIANIWQYYCGTYFAVCFAFWLLQIRRIGPIWSQYCQNIAIFEIVLFWQYCKILTLSSSAMIRQIGGTEVFCRHFSPLASIIVSQRTTVFMNLTETNRQMKKKSGTIVKPCSPDPSFIQSTIGKANWNDHMRKNVIDLYMDEMKRGGGTDNGLKSGYWTRISRQFFDRSREREREKEREREREREREKERERERGKCKGAFVFGNIANIFGREGGRMGWGRCWCFTTPLIFNDDGNINDDGDDLMMIMMMMMTVMMMMMTTTTFT
jgi:hypothetical protein